jgi:hypothetical protein
MEKFYNRINKSLEINKEENRIYRPLYLRNNFNERKNPLLIKEKFFNLKIYNPNSFKNNYLRNSLDVRDINYKENHLFKRETNPLDPKYNYDWQMTEVNEDRKINYINFNNIGNYPKELHPYKLKKNLNLDTYDIPGAQTGTKSPLSKIELRYGRKLNYIKDDIEGSHPGSLIKGIKTKRNNNLNKRYDYKSLLNYYNDHSKISSLNNNDKKNNKIKIENQISFDINKLSRNKNFLDGFGKDKKVYPREKYKNTEIDYNEYKQFEKELENNFKF